MRFYDPSDSLFIRELNLPFLFAAAFIGMVFGGGMIALEIFALVYAKIHNRRGMFADVVPGIWLGAFFVIIGILGMVIRRKFMDKKPISYRLLHTFLVLNALAAMVSVGMIAYIAYIMIIDRMTYSLCFGSYCIFDMQLYEKLRMNCNFCDDVLVHDVFVIVLFIMLVVYVLMFTFDLGMLKLTVRWTELLSILVIKLRKVVAVFCPSPAQSSQTTVSS